VQHMTFLTMARAGLRALEYFDPATGTHGQAHMQARLGITQHLLASGLARLEKVRDARGTLVDAFMRVDRAQVLREGRAAVGRLLVDLQVRKSTADGAGARAFYARLTRPIPDFDAELRELVLRKKQVRLRALAPGAGRVLTADASRARSSCSRTRSSRTERSSCASTPSRPRARSRASSSGDFEYERRDEARRAITRFVPHSTPYSQASPDAVGSLTRRRHLQGRCGDGRQPAARVGL
jgi:hypothetical protein